MDLRVLPARDSGWLERNRQSAQMLSDESPAMRTVLDAVAALSRDDPEQDYRRRELSSLVHVTLDHLPGKYADALVWSTSRTRRSTKSGAASASATRPPSRY